MTSKNQEPLDAQLVSQSDGPSLKTLTSSVLDASPAPSKSSLISVSDQELSLSTEATHALTSIAHSLSSITKFVSGITLPQVLTQIGITNGINGILNGLAAADGRRSLDARVIAQNATEIAHVLEKAFTKTQEHLKDKSRSDEILDAEAMQGFKEG